MFNFMRPKNCKAGSDCAIKVTLLRSLAATLIATAMAILAYEVYGKFHPGLFYQVSVTLLIAMIVAPIFLYPSIRSAKQLADANEIIAKQASTDYMTHLPNLKALSEKLDEVIADTYANGQFAVHFLDINRFKQVNDTLGHDVGNQLITSVGTRIKNWVGKDGYVARFGGDEFVVIQMNVSDEQGAATFGRDLRVHLAHRYELLEHHINVTTSVGTALYPIHGRTKQTLLKAADLALYKAKERTNANCVFDPSYSNEASNKARIENTLRTCVRSGELQPYFQSIVDAQDPLKILGFEALARIELPNGELLSPDDFIPIAENTGLIVDIGAHMLREACFACAEWHPNLFVSVNVSPVQLIRSDFIATVQNALIDSGLPAYRLELEMTETALIDEIELVRQSLQRIRAMGVQISLDDFGSGYCGLHYLRQIEVDKIKIDKSIIDEAEDFAIARNILNGLGLLAQQMDLTLVAEGVDDIRKADHLARGGKVQQLQGYLFSTPVNRQIAKQMQEALPQNSYRDNVVPLPIKAN